MHRASSLVFFTACGGALASLLALAPLGLEACVTTDATTTIVPITGISVLADSLVASRGCGTGATQVFKYVALVNGNFEGGTTPLQVGLFDCFTDGVFANLPLYDSYAVQVFAFNQAQFALNGVTITGLANTAPANLPVAVPSVSQQLGAFASWTSQCTATQYYDVESLAVCSPLVAAGSASVTVPTDHYSTAAGADGGSSTVVCGTDFASVSGSVQFASPDLGSTPAAVVPPTPCNTPISVPAPGAPATVTATLTLLSATGSAVGTAQCTGEALPNQTATPLTCVLATAGAGDAGADAALDAGGDALVEAGDAGGAADSGGPDGASVADGGPIDAANDAPLAD